MSTLALPEVFESNLSPDYGEIFLLLQEKKQSREKEGEKEVLQLPKPLQHSQQRDPESMQRGWQQQ